MVILAEIDHLKKTHKDEINELKRKLADSEKWVIKLWEFTKDHAEQAQCQIEELQRELQNV